MNGYPGGMQPQQYRMVNPYPQYYPNSNNMTMMPGCGTNNYCGTGSGYPHYVIYSRDDAGSQFIPSVDSTTDTSLFSSMTTASNDVHMQTTLLSAHQDHASTMALNPVM
jgi:hypothetical protein